jgi:CRP-like cAMP-binding protein
MDQSLPNASTVLGQHPVSRFLDARAQTIISEKLGSVQVAPGETMLREDERPDALYLLSTGLVDVYKTTASGDSQLLTTLKAPLLLGEVSFLLQQPCSATVKARDEVTGWALSRESLQAMLTHDQAATSGLLFYLGATLAERLRTMNEQVMRLKTSSASDGTLSLGEIEEFTDQWHGEFMLTEEVEPVGWEFGAELEI